jgi:Uma2 family endonuclease
MNAMALDVAEPSSGTAGWLPHGELTVDDLENSPDDGRRYELIDGVLIVGPSPIWGHQAGGGELFVLLKQACPPDLRVVTAPFDWRISRKTQVVPDIVVARFADLDSAPGRKYLGAPPLLVVEVAAPSTRRYDRTLKMTTYAQAGALSYWLVEPDPDQPSVTTYELGEDGSYRPGAAAIGHETLTVTAPFALSFSPWELLADLRPAGA